MHVIHSTGYDLHARDNAIVFRESRATPQRPDTPDLFWLYTLNALTLIDQMTYLHAKFGAPVAAILQVCEREPPAVGHGDDGSVAVCDFAYAPIRVFDSRGTVRSTILLEQTVWSGAPYAIALSADLIWIALPTDDVVLGVTHTGQIAYTVTAFSYPEHLLRVGRTLYVCAMGDRQLGAIDLQTGLSRVIAHFDEPVWEYIHCADSAVIRLQSGVYVRTRIRDEP